MAALFASFLSVPAFPSALSGVPPYLAAFVRAYRGISQPAIPALFYGFFAVFPARSPMDRKVPLLKWLIPVGWLMVALPNIGTGRLALPEVFAATFGAVASQALLLTYIFSGIPLGLASLASNAVGAQASDARRKARVLLWGTGAGVAPIVIETMASVIGGWQAPPWLYTATVVMASVFPLSFAYAVVNYRVLDIPVLLKRSARYLLVRRGFYVLIIVLGASATAAFTASFSRAFDVDVTIATAAGAAFGIALSVGSVPLLRRTTTRIDRAFFRSTYDASAILGSLAETIRSAASRQALAALLEQQISEALHPLAMGVFLQDVDGRLYPFAVRWLSTPTAPASLPADLPFLQELARRGKPWDVSMASKGEPPPMLRASEAECLVPILGRSGQLTGFLALGLSASEEPYSREDKRLLSSVANQAGIELDNIRLAEQMAERLDTERAAAREMEIARQVQSRLFPQRQPALRTLDYAGRCVQAQRVGGDYYDFVELGPGRVGLVVADISGKGIAGALLMANLQANLRSQYLVASDDLPRLLTSVNQLFFENTAENQYATLFFGDYSDDTRRLRYANCGHFPPFLLRADGTVEQLASTATVLGLFENWTTTTVDCEFRPGDVLVIYTDGVIEAANPGEEEFGTARLIETIGANREMPAAALVKTIQTAVQAFAQGVPGDDITVVVARVR